MARGRKFGPPKTQWEISIDTTTAAKIELLLFDPLTGTIPLGRRSQFIEALLHKYLEERQQRLTSESEAANIPGIANSQQENVP